MCKTGEIRLAVIQTETSDFIYSWFPNHGCTNILNRKKLAIYWFFPIIFSWFNGPIYPSCAAVLQRHKCLVWMDLWKMLKCAMLFTTSKCAKFIHLVMVRDYHKIPFTFHLETERIYKLLTVVSWYIEGAGQYQQQRVHYWELNPMDHKVQISHVQFRWTWLGPQWQQFGNSPDGLLRAHIDSWPHCVKTSLSVSMRHGSKTIQTQFPVCRHYPYWQSY